MKLLGQSRSHLISKLHKKMLAKAGPNVDPIAAPSTCLWYLLFNVKIASLVSMSSNLTKSCLGMLEGFSLSFYKFYTNNDGLI